MAWSTPSSVTTGDLITAATWNQDVVDNAQFLYNERIFQINSFRNHFGYDYSSTSTSFVDSSRFAVYKGSEIDETNITAMYASFMATIKSGSPNGECRLVADGGGNITSSDTTISDADDYGDHMSWSPDFSADANWPTGDDVIRAYFRVTAAAGTVNMWAFDIWMTGV